MNTYTYTAHTSIPRRRRPRQVPSGSGARTSAAARVCDHLSKQEYIYFKHNNFHYDYLTHTFFKHKHNSHILSAENRCQIIIAHLRGGPSSFFKNILFLNTWFILFVTNNTLFYFNSNNLF